MNDVFKEALRPFAPKDSEVQQTSHTQTPWRTHGVYREEIYATVDGKRFMVADVCGIGSQDQDHANAAFIVDAVNSIDALRASLSEMVAIYWGHRDGYDPTPLWIQRAQAALRSKS